MSNAAAIITAFAAAFAVTAVSGFLIIPWLRQLEFGQITAAPGFKHRVRQAIPSMGGVMLIAGTVSAILLTVLTDKLMGGDIVASGSLVPQEMYTKLWSGILMALAFSFIGFADDYIRAVKHLNTGLTIKQKSLMQILTAAAYLMSLYMGMQGAPFMYIPFVGSVETGLFHWIFGIVFIYATVNSADRTNGTDGLCSGVTATAAVSIAVIAAMKGLFGFSSAAAALAGSCIGFLLWNKNPAAVFPGSTGSMFLGGMTVALAYAIGCPLIIVLSGLAYVIEGASDIVQIAYFRSTGGKRILKMAPLHRHMQLCGMSEKKITAIFIFVNVLGAAAAVAVMYYGGYILR